MKDIKARKWRITHALKYCLVDDSVTIRSFLDMCDREIIVSQVFETRKIGALNFSVPEN